MGSIITVDEENYKLEYLPKEVGRYKIDVLQHDKPIWSKPTFVDVCDPKKIRVSPLSNCLQGKECQLDGMLF